MSRRDLAVNYTIFSTTISGLKKVVVAAVACDNIFRFLVKTSWQGNGYGKGKTFGLSL